MTDPKIDENSVVIQLSYYRYYDESMKPDLDKSILFVIWSMILSLFVRLGLVKAKQA